MLRGRPSIFRDGTPEALAGFGLVGAFEPFGGYSYVAGAMAGELHLSPAGVPGTLASASAPAPGLCADLILADRVSDLYEALDAVRSRVQKSWACPHPREKRTRARRVLQPPATKRGDPRPTRS